MNPGRIFLRPPAVRAGLLALATKNPGRILFGLLAVALLALPVATAAVWRFWRET